MKNDKTDLIVKIIFAIIFIISLYLIISGLSEKEVVEENNNDTNEILETGLIVNPTYIKIEVGATEEVTANVIPSNATYQNLTWEVGNTGIISLDNGIVKGLSPGTTYIRVTSEKQKLTRVINVTVVKNTIEITEIKPKEPSIEIYVGDEKEIEYTIEPDDATNKKVSYSIDNKEIIGFNKDGNIVGVKAGSATVTLKSNNGITSTISVKVKDKEIPVTSISVSPTSLTLKVNEEKEITVKFKPTNATDKTVTWSSSNEKVVIVTNGKVKGVSEGEATITAKTTNGKTASTKIQVGSPTKNKTAIFIGDSITWGTGYSWANYIGSHYDMKSTVNAGKSGGVLSNNRDADRWLVNVVKKYANQKFDYVILHGGINDASMGVALGSYKKNDFSGNYDTKSLIGGLEYYLYTAKKQWPNAKFGFIINYDTPRCNDCSKKTPTFYPKIMEVLKKWNISYINLYSGKTPSGESYSDLLKVSTNKYISDGVHLNRDGYNLISPYIYNWMKTL